MRIRVPGPSVVLGGAVAAADALETALGLVPRAAEAMTRLEALLDRAEKIGRPDRTRSWPAPTRRPSGRTPCSAPPSSSPATRAGRSTAPPACWTGSTPRWSPGSRRCASWRRRWSGSPTPCPPAEVTAAIALVDRMPLVLDHLENDVLPMLQHPGTGGSGRARAARGGRRPAPGHHRPARHRAAAPPWRGRAAAGRGQRARGRRGLTAATDRSRRSRLRHAGRRRRAPTSQSDQAARVAALQVAQHGQHPAVVLLGRRQRRAW